MAAAADTCSHKARIAHEPVLRIVAQMARSTTPPSRDTVLDLCGSLQRLCDSGDADFALYMSAAQQAHSAGAMSVLAQFGFGAHMRYVLSQLAAPGVCGSDVPAAGVHQWLHSVRHLRSAFRAHAVNAADFTAAVHAGGIALFRGGLCTGAAWVSHCLHWSAVRGLWCVFEGFGWSGASEESALRELVAGQDCAAASLGMQSSSVVLNEEPPGSFTGDSEVHVRVLMSWLDGSICGAKAGHGGCEGGGARTRGQSGAAAKASRSHRGVHRPSWKSVVCHEDTVGVFTGAATHPLSCMMAGLEMYPADDILQNDQGDMPWRHRLALLLLTCDSASAVHWAQQRFIAPQLRESAADADQGAAADTDVSGSGSGMRSAVATIAGMHGSCLHLPASRSVMPLCAAGMLHAAARAAAAAAAAAEPPGAQELGVALMIASVRGHTHVVEWLVGSQGVPVDTFVWPEEGSLVTALHVAAYAGHVHCMQVLMDAGAELGAVFDENGECAEPVFHRACAGGHVAAVQLLHEAGAFHGALAPQQHISIPHAVKYAVDSGSVAVLRYVIQHCQPSGWEVRNAAVESCWSGSTAALRMLASEGYLDEVSQQACVQRIVQYGSAGMLSEVLQAGFALNIQACFIECAGASGDQDTKFEILQQYAGAVSMSCHSTTPYSPLSRAACMGVPPSFMMTNLMRCGRGTYGKSEQSNPTVVLLASSGRRLEQLPPPAGRNVPSAMERVLTTGASPKAKNHENRNAMACVLMGGGRGEPDLEVVRSLVSHGSAVQDGLRVSTWPSHLTSPVKQAMREAYLL